MSVGEKRKGGAERRIASVGSSVPTRQPESAIEARPRRMDGDASIHRERRARGFGAPVAELMLTPLPSTLVGAAAASAAASATPSALAASADAPMWSCGMKHGVSGTRARGTAAETRNGSRNAHTPSPCMSTALARVKEHAADERADEAADGRRIVDRIHHTAWVLLELSRQRDNARGLGQRAEGAVEEV